MMIYALVDAPILDFSALFDAIAISPTAILTPIASALGICLSLAFAWWGARKLVSMFTAAFMRGKIKL